MGQEEEEEEEEVAAATAAFAAVLSKRSSVNVVCLLHEDFAHELPVFGPLPAPPAASGAGDGGWEGGRKMHVLMVLGTVRDMTRAEQVALVNVCAARRLPLVGCNLGRAPEFTSKIIHAINCHALNGRLRAAIAALPPVRDAGALIKLAPAHRAAHKGPGGQGATHDAGVCSVDVGGSGRKRGRGLVQDADAAVVPPCGQKRRKKDKACAPAEREAGAGRGVEGAGASGDAGVGCVHVVVGVPFELGDVTTENSRRDDLYQLSQVVVTTLWRSNLAEIMHASSAGAASDTHTCLLSISFSCGAVLTADQGMVYEMASSHRAAPSEHQVLEMLQHAARTHLRDQGEPEATLEEPEAALSPGTGAAWLKLVRTSGSRKAISKRILAPHHAHTNHMFVVDLNVSVANGGASGGVEAEAGCRPLVLDLAAAAYGFTCKCAGQERGGEDSGMQAGDGRGGEAKQKSLVIAVMWLGGAQARLGRGAGGGEGADGEEGRAWRDRVCRYLLKSSRRAVGEGDEARGGGGGGGGGSEAAAGRDGAGAEEGCIRGLRSVRLGPPGVCPSPQVRCDCTCQREGQGGREAGTEARVCLHNVLGRFCSQWRCSSDTLHLNGAVALTPYSDTLHLNGAVALTPYT